MKEIIICVLIVAIVFIVALAGRKCFIFHEWNKWKDKEKGNVTLGEEIKGSYVVQERRCKICNKIQFRIERTDR